MINRKSAITAVAISFFLIAFTGCRDILDVPGGGMELEESDDVRFLVTNVSDGWSSGSRAIYNPVPESWDDLPRMDSVILPYPNMFIQKDVEYQPERRTLEPYKPAGGDDSQDKGVERYPGTHIIPMSVQSASERSARLKVVTTPMTDKALGELRSAGCESRSTVVDDSNVKELYANIGVSAVCFETGADFDRPECRFKTMDNELVSLSGDRWQTTAGTYYWNVWTNDYNRIRFHAYAPYSAPGISPIDDDPDDGTPRFDYTVSADVDEQTDLGAITVATPANFHRTVPLKFDHILTGVRFLVDDQHMASCLRRVTLGGVHGSGTYKYSTKPYDFTDPDDTSNPNINPDNRPDKPGVTPSEQDIEKGTWTPAGAADAEYSLQDEDFFGADCEPIRSEWSQDDGDDYWCVTDPDRMFMLMPQQLPESAYIEAEFVDGDEHIIMRGKIGGKDAEDVQREWLQGTIVTYVITTYDIEYVLKLVKEGGAYPYIGGYDDKTVVSYARYYDKGGNIRKIVPVEWKPVYYDRYGTEVETPDWVTVTYDRASRRQKDYRPADFGFSGENVNDFVEYFSKYMEDSVCCGHVKVDPQKVLKVSGGSYLLREAPSKGTAEEPVNLAGLWAGSPQSTVSTSNCYIVNQPGYYNIPLVYGNAIKNGAPNPESYRYSGAIDQYRHYTFENHLGQPITNPYIKNCGAIIKDAALMSTTAQYTVQLVHLSDDYLTIYVDPNFTDQGSTVVVIRDTNGDIMWSWHIWTTYNNPYKTDIRRVGTSTSEVWEFMTQNIGWHTPDPAIDCPERAMFWKPLQHRGNAVIQPDKDKEPAGDFITKNYYRVLQDQYELTSSGHAPYYNWGRKDPLMRTIHRGRTITPDGDVYTGQSYRRTFINKDLTTHNIDGSETYYFNRGYYFVKQFTPGESVRVPWAMPSVCNLSWRSEEKTLEDGFKYTEYSSNIGATTNAYYVSWWTGNRDYITNPGQVPLKKTDWLNTLIWPHARTPNGDGGYANYSDYTRYDDLWCIDQYGNGYLAKGSGRMPIKTVYDPCPPNFMVPPNRAFENLNKNTGEYTYNKPYYFKNYSLELPSMPFLSARIGYSSHRVPNQLPLQTEYWGPSKDATDYVNEEYMNAGYVYPFTSYLFGNTCSLWTCDVSLLRNGGTTIIYGSYYNITGNFTSRNALLGDNGNTAQEGGINDARSSGNLWSMGARQVRAVKEK